ncbi:RNase H-like domain found in reverse transcriptase [Popillia japonica]|uniref:RNase H-like domain found in reverse transcriptase n=1 Tax=Popillia japonica TaxID=7064 RepID=A0AAW1I9Y1_POPJA
MLEEAARNRNTFQVDTSVNKLRLQKETKKNFEKEQTNKDKQCTRCGKKGHNAFNSINKVDKVEKVDTYQIDLEVNNQKIKFEIDTGTALTIIAEDTYKRQKIKFEIDTGTALTIIAEDTYKRYFPDNNQKIKFEIDTGTALTIIAEDTYKRYFPDIEVLPCSELNLNAYWFQQSIPLLGKIQTDASDYGLGAVLSQNVDGQERVVSYLSRSLSPAERKYSTVGKECLAVLWAIEKLRPYIEGAHFTVVTEHYSLCRLNSLNSPSGRLAPWAVRLQQYDFDIVHRKGKYHVVPDTLSRAVPKLHPISISSDTSDKHYLRLLERIKVNPNIYTLLEFL